MAGGRSLRGFCQPGLTRGRRDDGGGGTMVTAKHGLALLPHGAFLAVALAGGLLTLILCRIFARAALLPDIPNDRSSHRKATSRAGGLAIMIAITSAILMIIALRHAGVVPEDVLNEGARAQLLDLLALGLIAAGFGLVDDCYGLGPAIKALGQVLPALLFTLMISPFACFPVPVLGVIDLGWAGYPLTVFWIVGVMNVYNFMDGANGLAGACGALCCFAIALVSAPLGFGAVSAASLLTAFSLLGFLWVNLGEGRIFMGDAGSQSVAFVIAGFGVMIGSGDMQGDAALPFLFVPMILLPLIADVAFTLIQRVRRGENILQAHRQHAYQSLLRLGLAHWVVATLYASATTLMACVALWAISWSPAQQWLSVALVLAIFGFINAVLTTKAQRLPVQPTS
ncbi:MAG: hypothetical protein AAFW83_13715 [Pseudomonadota bacterium]